MKGDSNDLQRLEPVDLAREAAFTLGAARIRPSLSEVVAAGKTIRLQPRVMQVLVALVRAGGEVVSRDDLVSSCWSGLAIGDDAINRCIGRLRRLAEDEAPGSFAIETLARIGYRLTAAGAIDALASDPSPPPRTVFWRLGAAALVVVMVAAGAWFGFGRPGWPRAGEGVAVIPLDTAPGDPLARSFADGVADEVAGALAAADVKSLPLDTSPGQAGPGRDATAIQLGAAFALGGRVQRDGSALDVSVDVDDAQRHEMLWSADFTRPAAEAQALQEQVAARVAGVLHCALDSDNAYGGRIDSDSLRLYLRACDLIESSNTDNEKIRDLFRRVVAREPGFAAAWANLAVASELASANLPADEAPAARREAHDAAQRALRLDPKCGAAYFALAIMIPGPNHLWERQVLLQKGLSVSPEEPNLNYREAELLAEAGRYHETVAYGQRAASADPLFPYFTSELAGYLAHDGRLDEARTMIERAARIWPDSQDMLGTRISIEGRYGDPDRALALVDDPKSRPSDWEAPQLDDWRRFILARQSKDPGKISAYADYVMAQLAAGRLTASRAVLRLTSLGATDAAFAAAARATASDPLETEVLFRPPAEAMRRDPRFMPLAVKLGLVDFWRRTGHWADFCEAPDRPYDCRAEAAKLSS